MILLDEPTANLDVDHVVETLTLLRELAGGGATIALALHDLNVVSRWADTVAVLQDGRLRAAGPPTDVLDDDLVASVFGVRVERLSAADGRPAMVFHHRGGQWPVERTATLPFLAARGAPRCTAPEGRQRTAEAPA